MKPREDLQAIIGGVCYQVKGSTLLAHDEHWNWHRPEREGRKTFLYRNQQGYFWVNMTLGGEQDIEPLEEEEAYAVYTALPEHEVPVEKAFPNIEPL